MQPDFEKGNGLVPAIAQDVKTGKVLMMAYMDQEAWEHTLATGEAHYHSRSRNKLWHKGESSRHVQKVHAIRLDCDQDTILLLVDQVGGAACHKGYTSCFFKELTDLTNGSWTTCCDKIFDPKEVYQ
ncbi:MAG: phosphoribosyl-AMP cyclohydrolase [Deltaproteobacteria bacterium]|nr:MAG: phosphoribosyl-AMP cyclohydrolase [Deltaproteobacteria bacterium]